MVVDYENGKPVLRHRKNGVSITVTFSEKEKDAKSDILKILSEQREKKLK